MAKLVWYSPFKKAFVITLGAVGLLTLLFLGVKKVCDHVYNEDPDKDLLKEFEDAQKAAQEFERENEKVRQDFKNKRININDHYKEKYGYIPADGDYTSPVSLKSNQVFGRNDIYVSSNQIALNIVKNIDYDKLEGLTEEEKKFIDFLERSVKADLKGNNEDKDNSGVVSDEFDERVVLFKVRNSSGDLEEKTFGLHMLWSVLRDSAEEWIRYKNNSENIDHLNFYEEDFTSFINLFSKSLLGDGIFISYKDEKGLWNYFKDEDREID